MPRKVKYTKELLQEAANQSVSVRSMMKLLGLKLDGGNSTHMAKRIKDLGVDTSHFQGKTWSKGKILGPKKTANQILIMLPDGSNRPKGAQLRRCMLESGLEHKCQCGLTNEWNGISLTLEVDHIDGNWLNNLIENLRFLCPNCHSQQSTNKSWKNQGCVAELDYAPGLGPGSKDQNLNVGSNPITPTCLDCGKKIKSSAKRCFPCHSRQSTKIDWPSKEEVLKRLKTSNYSKLGRELGVSDNAIRKYLAR